MNPIVKIFFLPIMIVAGIFTAAAMTLINTPFAIVHRLRERRYRSSDLAAARAAKEQMLREIYGDKC